MKTLHNFLEAASEAQVRASNPSASPEMVRRAAERSKRSEAQRTANQKTEKPQIDKTQKTLPPGKTGGSMVDNSVKKVDVKVDEPVKKTTEEPKAKVGPSKPMLKPKMTKSMVTKSATTKQAGPTQPEQKKKPNNIII